MHSPDSGSAALRTIQHVPAMLAYWSTDQRCIFANAAYRDWFGREPREMVDISLQELLGPLYELNRPYIEGVLAGVPQHFERAITLPDGTVRHSVATYTPDVVDGSVVGFTAHVADITEQHEREEALRLATELLNRTGALAKVGGAELRLRAGEVFWTDEMFRILDFEPGEVPSVERWAEFFEADAREQFLAASEAMRSREMDVDLITPMITARGRRIAVRIQASSVVENGEVVKLVAAHQDVTAQQQADEARRESAGFTIGILDSIQDQVAVLDANGTIVAVNDAWHRSALEQGAPFLASDAIGLDYLGVLDRATGDGGEDAHAAAAGIRDVLHGRSPAFVLEYECPTPSEVRWFQMRVVPYVGPRRGVVVSHRNITTQRADDQARRLSDAALRAVTEGVVITDLDKRVVWMNAAFSAITGYSRDEMMGQTMRILQGAETDRSHVAEMQRAVSARASFAGEVLNYRRDGTPFWNELTIAPVRDPRGRVTHYVGVVRDITARREAALQYARLQEELQQAQKLESIGRLAGGVAHDFNNMLSAILGNAELALMRLKDGERPIEDLQNISEVARRSADLTRQLLAFARRQVVMPKAVDVNDAIERSLKMLGRLIGEEITVVWRPREQLWPINVDPTQLDQIIANLCLNARDAIERVGTIEIEAANEIVSDAMAAVHEGARPGDYVRVSVRDDGRGMDADTRSHIFEPFYTTKGVGEGTGLGLATVYGAVRQSQGFIEVQSTFGGGSTFSVYFPRHAGVPTPLSPESDAASRRDASETILLVEDEPAILLATTRLLERRGYHVLAAGLPEEALRIADAHDGEIDLLLTDVIMPQMTGRDLATALRATRPSIACIFVSGYPADVIAARGLLSADVNFLQKPCPEDVMSLKIREVLDRRTARH